jgi:hypothetical protein
MKLHLDIFGCSSKTCKSAVNRFSLHLPNLEWSEVKALPPPSYPEESPGRRDENPRNPRLQELQTSPNIRGISWNIWGWTPLSPVYHPSSGTALVNIIIQSIIQSLATGFVGTDHSTFNLGEDLGSEPHQKNKMML